jgi:hypothetical protein
VALNVPVQVTWLFMPNGRQGSSWFGSGQGASWQINGNAEFAETRRELEPVKADTRWFNNCDNDRALQSPPNPGHHEKASGAFLTGSLVIGLNVPEYRNKLSVKKSADQVLASHFGQKPLVLSADGTEPKGIHPMPQEYKNFISYSEDGKPAEKVVDPAVMFQRMFSGPAGGSDALTLSPEFRKRMLERASVLDTVKSHTTKLQKQVSSADMQRIDEYLTRVRALELDVTRAAMAGPGAGAEGGGSCKAPAQPGKGLNHAQKNRLILEMLGVSMECLRYRATSFMQDLEAEDKRFLGIAGTNSSHHTHSHGGGPYAGGKPLRSIKNFYLVGFAKLIKHLKSVRTPDGKDLLYHSVVVFGSGLGDSNLHDFVRAPLVVAGHGGGQLKPGRLVTEKTGLTAVNRRILQAAGVTGPAFDEFGKGITPFGNL